MPNVRLISLSPFASRAWRIGPWTAQMRAETKVSRARPSRTSPYPDHLMPGLKTSATLGTERGCPLTAHPDRVEATR